MEATPRLRVGILTLDWPPMSGGMARFCFETAVAMARRGHEITVLARRDAADVPGIRVVRGLIGDLAHDVHRVQAYAEGIDLWHGWEHGFGGLADAVAAPMVVTVHGNDLFSPKIYYRFAHTPMLHRFAGRMATLHWQGRMCRSAFKRVAAFLPNSANTARLLCEHYPECSRLQVIPCGVSDSFFQDRRPRGAGPPRLLTVCSLSRARPRKNVTGVLHALSMLRDSHEFHYDVIGGGDALDDHRGLAARLGLVDRVTFHGAVSDERLREAYRLADLFVLTPTQSDADVEGFGIVYLEANAAGLPGLATRTGGVTDAVCDGVSGYFAATADPHDIADAVRQFLNGEVRFEEDSVRGWANSHRYSGVAERVELAYGSAMGVLRAETWPSTAASMRPDTAMPLSIGSYHHVGNSQTARCSIPSV